MDQPYNAIFPKSDAARLDLESISPVHDGQSSFQPYGIAYSNEVADPFYASANFDYAVSSTIPRHASMDDQRIGTEFFLPLVKSGSLTDEEKESAKERRRTQNRFAQRAYRQRKEQAIKDQEKEIETLKMQLAKEKKINQSLAKVIEFLKERLNSKQSKS